MNHGALASAPSFSDLAAAIRASMGAKPLFVPSKTRILLNVPSYGPEEVIEALDSMMSGWMTMGKKVKAFEESWASYIRGDVNIPMSGVMTNSGSSANLLALSSLGLEPGAEVITPALTWATTVFPIAQAGYTPVLVDVDLDTYNISIPALEVAITPKTVAIMPVHLLGNPCDMDQIMGIADRHNLLVIEDACEAHGAEWHGRKVGSFGGLATFSFFFSHHISTIEGGMVMAPNSMLADELRSRRAFGWIREMGNKEAIAKEYPHIDPRFLFQAPGYNFRPTEMQGAFGIHQVPRLEGFIKIRCENMAYWNKELAQYQDWLTLPTEAPNTRHVSFAYAVTVKPGAPFSKADFMTHLESRGVECRPIEAGAMNLQPAMKAIDWRGGRLAKALYIHDNGFFWGNHHGIGPEQREAVAEYVHEFMRRF